jgi:hypothetical protein
MDISGFYSLTSLPTYSGIAIGSGATAEKEYWQVEELGPNYHTPPDWRGTNVKASEWPL